MQLKLFDLIEYKPATIRWLKSCYRTCGHYGYNRSSGETCPTTSIKIYNYNREYWKRYALKRDNGICQMCGEVANEVHHKKQLWEGGDDHPDNLISLCTYCHTVIDPWRAIRFQ